MRLNNGHEEVEEDVRKLKRKIDDLSNQSMNVVNSARSDDVKRIE